MIGSKSIITKWFFTKNSIFRSFLKIIKFSLFCAEAAEVLGLIGTQGLSKIADADFCVVAVAEGIVPLFKVR